MTTLARVRYPERRDLSPTELIGAGDRQAHGIRPQRATRAARETCLGLRQSRAEDHRGGSGGSPMPDGYYQRQHNRC
jgi:hypothetical protein